MAWQSSGAANSPRRLWAAAQPANFAVVVSVMVAAVGGWVLGVALLGLWPSLPAEHWWHGLWAGGCLVAGLVVGRLVVGRLVVGRLLGSFVGRSGGPFSAVSGRSHIAHFTRGQPWAPVLVFCSAALVAHGSTGLRTQARLVDRLPHAWEAVPLLVTGTVEELPRRSPQGVQFVFRMESARTLDGKAATGLPERIWLGWWVQGHVDALVVAAPPELRPGERWVLPVSLKRPHGTQNPGTFDAERWFLEQHLGASGSVSDAHRGQARRLGHRAPDWRNPEAWRAHLRYRIDAHVPDAALAGLVAGLTIGDQSAVEAADWQLFRDAGVAHALSISGAHITIFAALAAPAAAWVWRRWPRGCLLVPAPLVGIWAGGALALGYALLAGWGLPAQRTVAMLAVVGLSRSLGLHWPALLVWTMAAAPVVVWDPWSITQAGFWLSFAAVGLLLLAGAAADGVQQRAGNADVVAAPTGFGPSHWPAWTRHVVARAAPAVAQAVRTQVITAVGLAPLVAACFGQLSVVGVVGNLLALPWITLLLTPLCMLGLMWPALWGLLLWVVDPLRALMSALVSLPGAVVAVAGGSTWALGLALGGAALAMLNVPWRWRLCGLLCMMPLLLPPPDLPAAGRFELWALDVGQGSAVLVRTRHHALLVDAGPAWGEGRDAGERVVVPALRHLGVRRLDTLVVTHRDLDHVGGAASVLRSVVVGRTLSSLEPSHPLLKFPVAHEPCRRGQSWLWDGVRVQVLHPFGTEPSGGKPNWLSCVLRIEDGQGRSVLITGDIERDQEAALVRADPGAPAAARLRSDLLVVPHHGSRTSSTEPFLQAVQPTWAVAQAGYRNRYGHPARAVVDRYEQANIEFISSPWCGALHWAGDDPPRCWRRMQPRFWRDAPAPRGPIQ